MWIPNESALSIQRKLGERQAIEPEEEKEELAESQAIPEKAPTLQGNQEKTQKGPKVDLVEDKVDRTVQKKKTSSFGPELHGRIEEVREEQERKIKEIERNQRQQDENQKKIMEMMKSIGKIFDTKPLQRLDVPRDFPLPSGTEENEDLKHNNFIFPDDDD